MEKKSAEILVSAVQELSLAANMESVMRVVRKAARQLTKADGSTFVLKDEGYSYYADEDAIAPLWKGKRFPMSMCISGWVIENRASAVIEDVFKDKRIPKDAYRPTFVKSLAMVPIRSLDPIGAIGNYWADHHVATEDELKLLQSLADVAAGTIERIKLQHELEQRVQQRTRELVESLEREKQVVTAKTNFAAMVSHEFRTPLTTILSSLALMEEFSTPQLVDRQGKHFERIRASIDHLTDMMEHLLSLDKMEHEKAEHKSVYFNLPEFLQDIREETRVTLRKGQHVELVHHGEMEIYQDKKLLRNILLNLIANTARYSPENSRIEMEAHSFDGITRISLHDRGLDVPEIDQTHLNTRNHFNDGKEEISGSGLGLSIVKRYVDLLGGALHLQNNEESGATFTIEFENSPKFTSVEEWMLAH